MALFPMRAFPERLGMTPVFALVAAVALLVLGALTTIYTAQSYRNQQIQAAAVQGRILAESVSAALAFDDAKTAQEYINALEANPDIEAAGAYNGQGRLVASYRRAGDILPGRRTLAAENRASGNQIVVVTPVVEDGQTLGAVSLRATLEPITRRVARLGGLILLLGMSALVLATFAAAQTALARANTDLRESNDALHHQMAERERAEEALRQSQKMEALGQLTGGIAHDFNNLLMVVSSGVELLERSADAERRKTLMEAIRQAVDRGTGLTRQLLGFARRAALKPEVVDLGGQIEGLRVLLDRSLREDITVSLEVEDGVWPVEADPGELELAVLNMAVNARDAMPNGGTITICAENENEPPAGLEGQFVKLTVADTGQGMPPELAERVFEPFFTTKEVGRGTGLGLSQVYGFARASGGDVRIRSRVGEGTAIEVYLPRSSKPLPAKPRRKEADDKRAGINARILLVEDDDAVAAMVTDMLDGLGYRVTRAANAEAGLATLKHQGPFDLVFSDTVMPGDMDGIAMARRIRQNYPEQALLLTTGYSEAAAAAMAEGFSMLAKPYRMDALGEAVRAAQAATRVTP